MACPVCDHTMQWVVGSNVRKFYWCPRCGTLKEENLIFKEDDELREGWESPYLVGRVQEVCKVTPWRYWPLDEGHFDSVKECVTGGESDAD